MLDSGFGTLSCRLPGIDMKPAKGMPTPPVSSAPLDPHQFPLQPQKPPTADRDQVRAAARVRAPRQSQRPVERSK